MVVDIAIIYGLIVYTLFLWLSVEEYSTFHASMISGFVVIIIGLLSQFHLLFDSIEPHNNKPDGGSILIYFPT